MYNISNALYIIVTLVFYYTYIHTTNNNVIVTIGIALLFIIKYTNAML